MAGQRSSSRRFKAQRQKFFEQGKTEDAPCWICGQPIDYQAQPGTTPSSHELDHYQPVSLRPDLQSDPTNWRHAHRLCNQQRSNRTPLPGLGQPIPDWL